MATIVIRHQGKRGSVSLEDGDLVVELPSRSKRDEVSRHFREPTVLLTPEKDSDRPDEGVFEERVRGTDSLDAFTRRAMTLRAETDVEVLWRDKATDLT